MNKRERDAFLVWSVSLSFVYPSLVLHVLKRDMNYLTVLVCECCEGGNQVQNFARVVITNCYPNEHRFI